MCNPLQVENYLLPYIFAKKRGFQQPLALWVPAAESVNFKPLLLGTLEGAHQGNSPSRVKSPRCFLACQFLPVGSWLPLPSISILGASAKVPWARGQMDMCLFVPHKTSWA